VQNVKKNDCALQLLVAGRECATAFFTPCLTYYRLLVAIEEVSWSRRRLQHF